MNVRLLVVSTLALGTLAAQDPGVAPPPIEPAKLPADWQQRDLEGKWVAYRKASGPADADPRVKTAWMMALREAGEAELLEWIAVYEGWRHAGPQLAWLNSPRLMRAAAWNLAALDSHNKDNAEKAMRDRGGLALGWFEAHPMAQRGKAAAMFEELRGAHSAEDASAYLPPIDPMQALVPLLDAPRDLATFGDRLQHEPRTRYLHQVLRALDGVAVYGQVSELVVQKVLGLCRRDDPRLANAAFLTLGKLPPDRIPYRGLLRLADDTAATPAARRLATTALSHSSHPTAYFAIETIAADATHPGRRAAIVRLGEIGDDATLAALRRLNTFDIEVEVAAAITGAQALIERRRTDKQFLQVEPLRTSLRRVAWLRLNGDPRAAAHQQAVQEMLRGLDLQGALGGALNLLEGTPTLASPFRQGMAERVEAELAEFVAELRRM